MRRRSRFVPRPSRWLSSILVFAFFISWCFFVYLMHDFSTRGDNSLVRSLSHHRGGGGGVDEPIIYADASQGERRPGQLGEAVLVPQDKQGDSAKLFKIHQFNLYASDLIGSNRTLPDYRMRECKRKRYPVDLPDTSIIIVFHDEAWSTLTRTLSSIIDRSPRDLLRDIILVDDASTMDHLKSKLENFVRELPVHVVIERMSERSGLVKARLRGAAVARGAVLTFLDSHCECTPGWLEPLLAEVKNNRRVAACPIIDIISDDTFQYLAVSSDTVGGFNWKMTFDWVTMPERERVRRGKDNTKGVRSPTMAGGLFSIDKEYFYEVGSYDEGYIVWGGENLEMSFRLWQCGGEVLIEPCSHVGHVFRKSTPYSWPGGISYVINHNSLRTAMVWLDEYKVFVLKNMASDDAGKNYGDITDRLRLRQQLGCKSFRWYLENIFPESPLPLDYFSVGYVRTFDKKYCLDTGAIKAAGDPVLIDCHYLGGNQLFALTAFNQLMNDRLCLDGTNQHVRLQSCTPPEAADEQRWSYNVQTQQLVHVTSGLCLDAPDGFKRTILAHCNGDETTQRWELEDFKGDLHQHNE